MTEIAREYGTALFMLGCEENCKHELAEGLCSVRRAFLEAPDYERLLASPSIPLEERLAVIRKTFEGAVPTHVLSYLQLLCERGRIAYFLESVEVYQALLDASERVSNAKVTSAIPLNEAEREKLQAKLEAELGGRVNVEYAVDASLLGGLVVETDGKIMDASLRRRLREVKEVMSK